MDRSVYINKIALFLPNCPISNEEMEDYIGLIGGIAIRNKQNTVVTIKTPSILNFSIIHMKRLFLFAFMVCTFSNINAQYSIIGKVLIENGDTLESNVQLYTKSHMVVSAVQTQKGMFSFSNLAKNNFYYVVASHVGYTTDTIKIDRITKDLNIGIMFLKNSVTTLDEVTVVGSSISFQNGSKRIFPNEFQRNSPDAMVMLDKMNL